MGIQNPVIVKMTQSFKFGYFTELNVHSIGNIYREHIPNNNKRIKPHRL